MTDGYDRPNPSRRLILGTAGAFVTTTAAGLSACGGSNGAPAAAPSPVTAAPTVVAAAAVSASSATSSVADGLHVLATQKGMYYGAALQHDTMSDQALLDAYIRECGVIVAETEMKWGALESVRGRPYYTSADAIVDFAKRNAIAVRGHTLSWYLNLPKWFPDALAQPGGIDLLYEHVTQMVTRYKGKVFEWDVVNEAIEPKDNLAGGLKNSLFYKAGGADYIAKCFRLAHTADPKARLTYNEWGLDYKTDYEDNRRLSTVKLLESLLNKGAPVHALGIQAHLKVGNRFDAKTYETFLADIASLGLKIIITELDIDDQRLVADTVERDQKVAEHATSYLDVAFAQPAVIGLVTWGLSDRYHWLNKAFPRADGLPHRSLPLDADMNRKPVWQAMADCFKRTSVRPS